MIPWIPLSVLSDLAQPRTEPLPDDVHHVRNPLGFSDVRAHAAPATLDPAPATRGPIGFAGPRVDDAPAEPVFRTELSFRRTPRPMPVAQAETGGHGVGSGDYEFGHASAGSDELWPGDEASAAESAPEAAEEKVRFYKKEIGLFRRKAKQPEPELGEDAVEDAAGAVADADVIAEAEIAPVEPVAEYDLDLEPVAEAELDDPVAEIDPEPVADFDDTTHEVTVDDVPETVVEDAPLVGEAAGTDDNNDGNLWGDEQDALPVSDADAADEVAGSETDAVDAAPVADAPSKRGRSVRARSGGSKPKTKRGSGRGERGGRKVVGLKIGASQLAAAVVQKVEGRSELVHAARVPLEPGIVVDGDVKDKTALANALKSFFEDNGLPRRDIRIGLASNRIGVRTSDVVGIDDPERFDNAVRFKAHEVLPVAAHESVLDYRVIDERASEEGESLRRVLMVVAPRDQVEPYLDVCKDAGLRLAGVDLEALGLLRAFVEPRTTRAADDTATVVVSIGHEASTLLVAGGGACEFTRVFDWGGGALQDSIAQELDVHAAEAGTILRHLALSGAGKSLASLDDDSRQRALDAVRSKLTPFARELVSSLQFYQTQPESLGIGEIVITGGTSHLAGLADSLHQMIGVNVRVGDPLQRVVARAALDPSLEATIGSLAVPIGLALEDDAMRSVNLLPTDLQQSGRRRPDWAVVALPVAAAASVAALGFMFLQANSTAGDREAELAAVQAEIAALPKPQRPVIDPDVATTEAGRAVALAGVLGGRISWDGVLRDVALVLPANVSLTRMEAKLPPPVSADQAAAPAAAPVSAAPALPTGVSVEGYTKDQPSVARLLARLRTVPSLSNVQLESSSLEKAGNTSKTVVRFIILADIKQPGGAQ